MNQSLHRLTSDQQHRIFSGAVLASEEHSEQTYYDTDNYSLTATNRWLQQSNDQFVLKVPLTTISDIPSVKSKYFELTSTDEIRKTLKITNEYGDMQRDLFDAGFSAYCVAKIVRRTFLKDGVAINVYSATYPGSDHTYLITSLSPAEPEANSTVGEVGIKVATSYLKQEAPEHYGVLAARKVVQL